MLFSNFFYSLFDSSPASFLVDEIKFKLSFIFLIDIPGSDVLGNSFVEDLESSIGNKGFMEFPVIVYGFELDVFGLYVEGKVKIFCFFVSWPLWEVAEVFNVVGYFDEVFGYFNWFYG